MRDLIHQLAQQLEDMIKQQGKLMAPSLLTADSRIQIESHARICLACPGVAAHSAFTRPMYSSDHDC
jgi:hypothetical protein